MNAFEMKGRAQIGLLPDGRRVHMQDGPIDLIVEAWGEAGEIETAYRAAAARFAGVLDELCGELKLLRRPAEVGGALAEGLVARRMMEAVQPYAARTFITPMAAVAGAVAEDILLAMTTAAKLSRAYVNDGGDIALHLTAGEKFVVGMAEYLRTMDPAFRKSRSVEDSLLGATTISYEDPIRGIATSGWSGRSFSLGIADAVTVLADTAAMADAAATMIANAVDLPGHPAILRVPASQIAPDSDLGERLVTQAAGRLSADEIREALEGGMREAQLLCGEGLIRAAALNLQGEIRVVGSPAGSHFIGSSSTRESLVHA